MFGIIRDAMRAVWSAITRAKDLAAENIALRHQLDVLLCPTRSRPRLRPKLRDRILLVWLSRIWAGWKDAVRIVQPETVIAPSARFARSGRNGIVAAGSSTGRGGASGGVPEDRPFRRTSATSSGPCRPRTSRGAHLACTEKS